MSVNKPPGYLASKKQIQTRLARIEGQVRGIARMVDEERYCIDVLTQIAAVEAALDKVALGLLNDHVQHCLIEGNANGKSEELVDEVLAAVARLMGRG